MTVAHRDLVLLAEDAVGAIERYADALYEWNAPDDEHTRIQLRRLVEEVIAEHEAAS